ncbi:MAG: RNA polymerase subunit sigma [Planctomycetes bacterium]|nr:RNA polymerase subunit sigma [Planctomycetota bacterium]
MVSGLCRVLGPGRLDLVEDVVQEALARALRSWPAEGVPDNPEAWVFRVARNLALDSLRRQKIADRVEGELQHWARLGHEPTTPDELEHLADETLRMLFLCSHPAVPADARVPLILKTVCGFGVPAIAAALLQKEATIAQRLVRAKARLREDAIAFAMPPAEQLPTRLDLVLQVIYLLFNEGYRAHLGTELVREDLVHEALRLCSLLLDQPQTAGPSTHALFALMLLLGARLPARLDDSGELLTLAEQDRGSWNQSWIAHGFDHFRQSIAGEELSPYHCEAAIASLHTVAPSYDRTDWSRILAEYDRLLLLSPTPIVKLNRAVAVSKVHGIEAGLRITAALDHEKSLANYFLLPATTAWLHWQRGDHAAAAAALEIALQRPASDPEQRELRRRLEACRRGEPPPH